MGIITKALNLFDKLTSPRPKAALGKKSGLIEVAVERDYTSPASASRIVANAFHRNPWAFAATASVARTIAGLKPEVYTVAADGTENILTDGPAVAFFRNPCPHWSMYDMLELLIIDLYQRGRAFWELSDVEAGKKIPLQAIPLPASFVSPIAHGRRLIDHYEYSGGAGDRAARLEVGKIAHFRFANPDDLVGGTSPYEAAGDSLELYDNAIKWNKAFFKNSALPEAYLQFEGATPEKAERKRIKVDWKNSYGGPDKAHDIAIIGGGAKLIPFGTAPKDAEFSRTMGDAREVILACSGVPPIVVGMDIGSYANAYQQLQSYWDETIVPITQKICDEWNRKVMPALGVTDGLTRVRLPIYDKLKKIKEDAARMSTVRQWYQTQLLTREEARQEGGYSAEPPEGQSFAEAGLPFGGGMAGATSPAQGLQFNMKKWTPEGKAAFQKQFSGRIDRYMGQVAMAVLKLFEAQYQAAVKYLVPPEEAAAKAVEKAKKVNWKALEEALEEAAYDEEGNIKKTLARVLMDASGETARELGLEVKFDVRNPKVAAHLRRQAGDLIKDLHGTSLSRLRETLEEGYDLGEGVPKLKRRVAEVFGDRDADSARMTTIARTESGRAASFGAQQTYLESGVVHKKEWVAAVGAVVPPRPEHLAAHGQVVAVDEPYIVGGESLMQPLDPAGSAAMVCNCRCSSIPIVEGFENI